MRRLSSENRRVLGVFGPEDDVDVVREALGPQPNATPSQGEFGQRHYSFEAAAQLGLNLEAARSACDAVEAVRAAHRAGQPYAVVLVNFESVIAAAEGDLIERLRCEDPDVYVVLCAARFEGVVERTVARLECPDRVILLKRPFELSELRWMVLSLVCRWESDRRLARRTEELALALDRERDAVQEAVLANRARNEFLANMSHEIRTPLNSIIGFGRLLSGLPLDQEHRRWVQFVRDAGVTLLAIVNDILDLSTIEAGQLRLDPTDFALAGLLERVRAAAALAAKDKPLVVEVVLDPSVPTCVRGDETRLEQILANLMLNAVKFTESGSVVCRCALEAECDERLVLRFEVEDTGIGIDAGQQERIFQSFVQADSSATRKYGGTGLGLAICKRLVELMDGRIGVQSVLGRGSTFWTTVVLEKPRCAAPEDSCNSTATLARR